MHELIAISVVLVVLGGCIAFAVREARKNGKLEATHEMTMEKIDDLLEVKLQDDIVNSNPDVAGMSTKLSAALREV